MLNHHHSYRNFKKPDVQVRVTETATQAVSPLHEDTQKLQKQTLLLLVVLNKKDNPPDMVIKDDTRVGAIVMAESWQSRAYAAVYGELVFVRNNEGRLEIIQTGEICTVNKERPIACVAHIKNKVLIPLQANQIRNLYK